MRRLSVFTLLLLVTAFTARTFACTAFLVCGNGLVLAGNNEDFWNTDTKLWFKPAGQGLHGCVFFGFGNGYPQGGMNDQGLFYDGFATARQPVEGSLDKPYFEGNIVEEAMRTCATVQEVVDLFDSYNLKILEHAMLMFGDKTGDSVIIEGDEFLRKDGDFQVVTNFYQSCTAPEDVNCARFKTVTELLETDRDVSVDLCRRALAAAHVEMISPTQYSNIYDLVNGKVYLYHFHNFENEVVLDLEEELEKGERMLDLPDLFPKTFAFDHFKAWKAGENQKIVRERRVAVDPDTLDDFAGRYELEGADVGGLVVLVRREGGRLLLRTPGAEASELIPSGPDRFFQVGDYGFVDFAFHRDAEGRVARVTWAGQVGGGREAVRIE